MGDDTHPPILKEVKVVPKTALPSVWGGNNKRIVLTLPFFITELKKWGIKTVSSSWEEGTGNIWEFTTLSNYSFRTSNREEYNKLYVIAFPKPSK